MRDYGRGNSDEKYRNQSKIGDGLIFVWENCTGVTGERVKDERIFYGDVYNPVANLHGVHSICIKKTEERQRGK